MLDRIKSWTFAKYFKNKTYYYEKLDFFGLASDDGFGDVFTTNCHGNCFRQ